MEGVREHVPVDEAKQADLKREMDRLVAADLAIEKRSMNTDDAIALFHELGMTGQGEAVPLPPQLPCQYLCTRPL